ncbi:alpha/beta hydrolase [Neotabrizicola shimadae]|uniref:Alpha/beta hydrolase n=1 Tax=Neotabrizicola shimadae TaxID=2807096 RepID=A0A8G0ZT29_9RHOB|nr:alpha/beta hydrolase [Neotabrizicola shimadae]QYZ69603.1 alpha/beta hydrolase [Neotabrizicola shimadae]
MADPNSPDGPNGIYVLPFADTSHVARRNLDLAYASASAFQKLDLYLPDGPAPASGWPLIVYVHGGAWMMCDKADVQLNAPLSMLAQGFAVASVNYRLSSEARFPAQIHDVKAAIRWLRAHAGRHDLDPARFAAWGCSAGGHLVSLAGMTNDVPVMEDPAMGHAETSSAVQAVVSFFGPTKLDQMDQFLIQTGAGEADHLDPQSPESRLLGGVPTTVPGQVIAANPETWVTPACPPFLLLHAPMDPIVPVQHSVMLSQRITAIAGEGRARLRLVEGAGHATPQFDQPDLLAEVAGFLGAVLKAPAA